MAIDSSKYAATGDFSGFLSPEMSAPIFDEVNKTSVVQQLARQIPMGPTGVDIPFWDGTVSASWVDEAGKKPVTKGGLGKQTLSSKKIATIFVESAEVVRANPGNYLNIMRGKVAEAIALAFDDEALYGTHAQFNKSLSDTTLTVALDASGKTVYDQANSALGKLVKKGKKLNGFLLDNVTEPTINAAKDSSERPLFIEATYTETNSAFRQGRLLGRPTYLSDHVASGSTVGFAGDWTQLVWGQVGGLTYDVSDQASLDLGDTGLTSLWQHNLVAVRVEAEYAVLVNDTASFVKLTQTATS